MLSLSKHVWEPFGTLLFMHTKCHLYILFFPKFPTQDDPPSFQCLLLEAYDNLMAISLRNTQFQILSCADVKKLCGFTAFFFVLDGLFFYRPIDFSDLFYR